MTKNWKKLQLKKKLYFFLSKTTIFLSLGFHKGRPNYKRSLQFSKENIQHLKHKISSFFLHLWVIFALLDPDPDSEYGSGSGSETLVGTPSQLGKKVPPASVRNLCWRPLFSCFIQHYPLARDLIGWFRYVLFLVVKWCRSTKLKQIMPKKALK